MAMRDIAHRIKMVQSIATAAHTAAVNGASVDLAQGSGYEAAAFYIDFGAWTDGTHTFTFQDSADNATWNTLAVPSIQNAAPAVSTNGSQNSDFISGYYGGNRYLRVITTVTGQTTGAVYGAGVVLGFPHHGPAV